MRPTISKELLARVDVAAPAPVTAMPWEGWQRDPTLAGDRLRYFHPDGFNVEAYPDGRWRVYRGLHCLERGLAPRGDMERRLISAARAALRALHFWVAPAQQQETP